MRGGQAVAVPPCPPAGLGKGSGLSRRGSSSALLGRRHRRGHSVGEPESVPSEGTRTESRTGREERRREARVVTTASQGFFRGTDDVPVGRGGHTGRILSPKPAPHPWKW